MLAQSNADNALGIESATGFSSLDYPTGLNISPGS